MPHSLHERRLHHSPQIRILRGYGILLSQDKSQGNMKDSGRLRSRNMAAARFLSSKGRQMLSDGVNRVGWVMPDWKGSPVQSLIHQTVMEHLLGAQHR